MGGGGGGGGGEGGGGGVVTRWVSGVVEGGGEGGRVGGDGGGGGGSGGDWFASCCLALSLVLLFIPRAAVSEKGVVFLNRTEFYQVGFKRGYKSVATPLPPDGQLLAASDTV